MTAAKDIEGVAKAGKTLQKWLVWAAGIVAAFTMIGEAVTKFNDYKTAQIKAQIDAEIGPMRKVIKWFLDTNPAARDSLKVWSARQDCTDAILRGDPCRGH